MELELKKRIGTAVVGVILLISLIIYGRSLGVFLIASVISLGMLFEFSEMTFSLSDRVEKRYLLLSLGWLVAFINFVIPRIEFQLLIGSFVLLFSYFLFSAKKHAFRQGDHFKELMYSIFGLVYLAFVPLYFGFIYDMGGAAWFILFLVIVWAGDTGAYFAGKRFGKRKLYPQISPKKTVEGAIGGLALGLLATLLFKAFLLSRLSWAGVVLLPVLVGCVAQIGDLCESFFKRAFDKKDSGGILPGHGGFLDRFDGVVFSLPIMYICMRVFA